MLQREKKRIWMLRAIGIHSFPSIILCALENKHSDHKGPTHEQRLHQSTAELITHNARNQYHVIHFYTILIPKHFQCRPPLRAQRSDTNWIPIIERSLSLSLTSLALNHKELSHYESHKAHAGAKYWNRPTGNPEYFKVSTAPVREWGRGESAVLVALLTTSVPWSSSNCQSLL